ncbi:MAG: N-6 DNA methylase, partial [Chloroflexi bacterium]|nr:N-6 DNA methylase [Chloroflexota bacterium]
MPSYPHIERYRAELAELIEFGGSDSELNIRAAFQGCLAAYCRDHRERLLLVPELAIGSNIPDGTVKDALRMARGYWEAKDTHDDLDAEIQAKFNRGYPRDNIVFEDSETAVLFQNGAEAMRVEMTRAGELHRLIQRFLDYELPEIEEFRQARQQFKADLPAVLDSLREAVGEAEAGNPEYRVAADAFLELCRKSISPDVSDADVREMLLQHILTKDIFLRVFAEDQFHRENNVARQLDALERTFFTGDVRRQAIDRLRAYYGAIGRAADEIADYAEKQQFLKAIYEDFYQAYNPAAADRLGVVYTPNEVVDFIIRGTDYLLQKHFGKTLADDNVNILDPATGTGTFITNLINHLPADRLEHKYLNEIYANEVAILPYYIANLNIEYTYKERTGRYLEFPNLCFVDTLDNMDWQGAGASGGAVQRQAAFNLGGLSEENWIRVQEQNEKPISVIIGNPPYNSSATLWGDGGANRQYPDIDQRIRDTYIAAGTAQKTSQYDMYKRFMRWASDRLSDDGIIGFITNRRFLDARQDDGFRQIAGQEFTDIYILDLSSDVRRNPKISGTTHNVFGIQTGVAITFLVREKAKLGQCGIHYARREDAELATEKLAYLGNAKLSSVELHSIEPDADSNWLEQSVTNF